MPEPIVCPACRTEVAPNLRACPACGQFVHADRLKTLAAEARGAETQGNLIAALTAWREALDLLPTGSRQAGTIEARIADLGRRVDSAPATPPISGGAMKGLKAGAAGLGAFGLMLWKFKVALLVVLSKGKFLLLGLTKAGTLVSMVLSLGVYATVLGGKFVVGMLLSIYIHEMGHVSALLRYGVKASAPMFLPGIGAVIRLQQRLGDPRQEARVGLAGPAWGLGASLAAAVVALATGWPTWAAVAKFGAALNLFNLLPVWQLDGGRAFRSLTRPQRWLAVAGLAPLWPLTGDSLMGALPAFAAYQAIAQPPADRPDRAGLVLYLGLAAALAALTQIHAPLPAR